MIKLMDLLKEISNNDEIYHWTSYSSCQKIIESNKLKSNEAERFFSYDEKRILPEYKNVVFFTFDNGRFADEESSNQCILVINKSKLFKDYKVVSYGDPYEETVLYTNDSYIPILPYLEKVILNNTIQKRKIEIIINFLEEKNIPYIINDTLEKEKKEKEKNLPQNKKLLIQKFKNEFPKGVVFYLNPIDLNYPTASVGIPSSSKDIKIIIPLKDLDKNINWYIVKNQVEKLLTSFELKGTKLDLKGNFSNEQK
jgi:hypothetical protein